MAKRRPKGQGGIRNLGSERTPSWKPYFYVPDSSLKSGRRMVSGPGFRRKVDAEHWLRDQLAAKDHGRVVTPSKITFGQLLEDWFAVAQYSLADNTAYQHQRRIESRIKPALGSRRLSELRPPHLTQFLHAMRDGDARTYSGDDRGGLSERTIELHYRTMDLALTWGVQQQIIARNPLDDVPAPKASADEKSVWTAAELARFLEQMAGHPFEPLFHLAFFTGARRSELLGLHWERLDLDEGTFHMNRRRLLIKGKVVEKPGAKSKRGVRPISLDEGTVSVLRRHRAEKRRVQLECPPGVWVADPNVFTDEVGAALHPQRVTNLWANICATTVRAAGLPEIGFHDARHTHASLLLAARVPVTDVAQRLGDAPETVMRTYAHFIPGRGPATADTFARVVEQGRQRPS